MDKDFIMQTAKTIQEQILWSINKWAYMSWGVSQKAAIEYEGMATLALRVSGLRHKGWVYISLNEGMDCYEVRLLNVARTKVKATLDEVYCDNLGEVVDGLVEKDPTIPDDEYRDKALKDSARKMGMEVLDASNSNNSNNQNSTVMKQTFKAADLIGKTIVVGDNQATIVIKSVDGDKLSGEFTKDGKTTPMSFPISQLQGMTEKGLWKLTDSTEATDVTTEADVQEVQDIVPVVTPKAKSDGGSKTADVPQTSDVRPQTSNQPTAKVEPIKATVKSEPKPKAKDVKPETKGGKYAYATYQTKKGKQGAKITGFASEDDVFYAMAADIHASGSYERDKQGNKHYYLCFGPRYAEAAKSICKVLNSDKAVNQKVEECKLIVSQATEELATKREEWKQKREERKAQTSAASHQPSTEKTYTQTELAEWLRKLNAGDPNAAKFFNDLAKAA